MKSTDIYKEFYFKEIDRRDELNNAINLPILIISGITSVHVYFYSKLSNEGLLPLFLTLSILTSFAGLYSIFYLIRSFTNFYYNHKYQILADMNLFWDYEQELLETETKDVAIEKFESHLNKEFVDCHKVNFAINIERTRDIAKSKKGIFWGIIFTLIFTITFITSNYLKMNQKPEPKKTEKTTETTKTEVTKMETKVVGPKSVKIMCSKTGDDKKKKNN